MNHGTMSSFVTNRQEGAETSFDSAGLSDIANFGIAAV
jgi:hypothetical protein